MDKYQIIYADPAWSYKSKSSPNQINKYSTQKASNNYKSMSINDLRNLPIKDITSDNAMLFLWVTFPLLEDCLSVISPWGFKYKTIAFNWIKLNKNHTPWFGMGYYTKSNSEVCLLGIKGKPKVESNFVSSIILNEREKHSKKPSIVRNKIVELCGDVPRIELFARNKTEGWDVWGNEVESDIHLLGEEKDMTINMEARYDSFLGDKP